MNNKIFPNTPSIRKATIDDVEALPHIQLKSVEVYQDGIYVKSLNATQNHNEFAAPLVLTNADKEGLYTVKWNFSLNGELIPVSEELRFKKQISISLNKDESFVNTDPTLPDDVAALLGPKS